ncbi:hypothetical protein SLEP1_g34169 [Rubroshorea leprosula]|uniref:CCHC-type domain-containing protein n=1 Tax=Rubroshorea leprosula TaxID=152421 RepID=A0AAV5KIY5_9ROSI|nr:hypothetical protein SLEP1_g34169 [Rubroshorea leprosula]
MDESSSSSSLSPSSTSPIPTGPPFLSTIFAPSSPVVSVTPSIPIPPFPPTSSSLPTTLASFVFSHPVFSITNIRNYYVKGLSDRLFGIGHPVSDKDLVLQTIASLDHSFLVAKHTIPQRVPFPTFLELRSLLLIKEANILQESSTSSLMNGSSSSSQLLQLTHPSDLQIHYAAPLQRGRGFGRNNSFRGGQTNQGRGSRESGCTSDGQVAGFHSANSSTHALPSLLPTSPTPIACQWCNRLGHQARDCSFLTARPASASSAPQSLYANLVPTPMDPNWYFDSGAQTHATNNPSKLLHSTPSSSSNFIQVGNGQLLPVTSHGNAFLSTSNSQFRLNNVLVAPHLTKNLVSIRQFTRDNNCSVNFDSFGFSIKDNKTKNVLLRCNSPDGLYSFSSGSFPSYHVVYSISHSPDVWHCRLGHPGITSIQHLARRGLLPIESVTLPSCLCHACQLGKHPRVLPSLLATGADIREPKTFKEACQFSEWRSAMVDEFSALLKNNTWSLVPRPSTVNVVGSKWVYRIKQKDDGSIERFKARLVAQGFTQQQGIDYDDTFSLVVKPVTIQTVLALAVMYSWPIHQLDVNNAFLHGRLFEVVYMSQPSGFIDPQYPSYVCRLNRALYGLKQAPHAWFQRFASFLFTRGFSQARSDSSMFLYHSNGAMAILLLYVDDIVLTASTIVLLHDIISLLKREFLMIDLGQLNYVLGISVSFNFDGLFLSQSKYTHELLERSGMLDCKPVVTPMEPKAKLFSTDGPTYSDSAFYRSIVGALQYLTFTRPDIAFVVGQVCQHMHAPTHNHFTAVKRILCYLKGTLNYGLQLFRNSSLSLHMFTDANWAGCVDTRRFISGYCLFLGNSLISWSSKKQNTVARSSAEAEYRAIANAVAEVLWVRQLLSELHVFLHSPPMVYCDNISSIYMSLNPVQHQRTKHIEIDIHFVRERVASGIICIQYVPSSTQRADVLTKALSFALFRSRRSNLSVLCSPAQIVGG